MIDLHCHILPGLDDGAQTPGMALAMARKAASDGIETIVATPHVFRDGREYWEDAAISCKCEALNRVLGEKGIPVRILPGAEVHVSHDLIAEIRAHRKGLVLNESSYLSVEFPEDLVFSGTAGLFFDLMSDGITPIIAHPERNSVFQRDPARLVDLIRMGALAQANAGSLSGRFGSRALDAVRLFLKSNLIHILASDAHNEAEPGAWLSGAVSRAADLVGPERARAMVEENPRAVISDKPLPECPSPADPRIPKKASFKLRIPNILRPNR